MNNGRMLVLRLNVLFLLFFFFNDTATTEIYTLSLHDALPISGGRGRGGGVRALHRGCARHRHPDRSEEHTSELQSRSDLVCRLLLEKKNQTCALDRKSTRLNSSHDQNSYAVFCLQKNGEPGHVRQLGQAVLGGPPQARVTGGGRTADGSCGPSPDPSRRSPRPLRGFVFLRPPAPTKRTPPPYPAPSRC